MSQLPALNEIYKKKHIHIRKQFIDPMNFTMSYFSRFLSHLEYRQTCTRHMPFLKGFSDSPQPKYFDALQRLMKDICNVKFLE